MRRTAELEPLVPHPQSGASTAASLPPSRMLCRLRHCAVAFIAAFSCHLATAGCQGAKSTPCGDSVCSIGWRCATVSEYQVCVLPWQLAACADQALQDGDRCDQAGFVGYHCVEGVCLPGQCGDGVLDTIEECDDGAANSGTEPDACRLSCRLARCGDGVTDPANLEACDDGAQNSNSAADACRTNCLLPFCGDHVKDQGEMCDGSDLGGATCTSLGFAEGSLSCSETCQFQGCT